MAESPDIEMGNTKEPSTTSKASTIDSSAGPTKIIPFDGKGEDPATLVGLEVHWYYMYEEPPRLELKCPNGRVQFHKEGTTEDWDPNGAEDVYEFWMDDNLDEALNALHGRADKTLTILEAVVGQRESEVCAYFDVEVSKLKHRVIGIRLEGMDQLGYIFCKTEYDGDIEGFNLYFYDVVMTSRWINFRSY